MKGSFFYPHGVHVSPPTAVEIELQERPAGPGVDHMAKILELHEHYAVIDTIGIDTIAPRWLVCRKCYTVITDQHNIAICYCSICQRRLDQTPIRKTGAELLGEEGIVIPAGEQSAATMTGQLLEQQRHERHEQALRNCLDQKEASRRRSMQGSKGHGFVTSDGSGIASPVVFDQVEPLVGTIVDLNVIFLPTLKVLCDRFGIDSFPPNTIAVAREDPTAMDGDGTRYEVLVYGPPVRICKRDGSVLYEPIEGAKLFSMTFTIDVDTFWQIVNPF